MNTEPNIKGTPKAVILKDLASKENKNDSSNDSPNPKPEVHTVNTYRKNNRKSTMELYREMDESSQEDEPEVTKIEPEVHKPETGNDQSTLEFGSAEILEAMDELEKEKKSNAKSNPNRKSIDNVEIIEFESIPKSNSEFTKYRDQKKTESSFEIKKESTESHDGTGSCCNEPDVDDPDWMFKEQPEATRPEVNSESGNKSRKTSEDNDWMLLEIEKLGRMKTGSKSELTEVTGSNLTSERDGGYLGTGKRKTTPAKGTYNPQSTNQTNQGILDQLGTSNDGTSKIRSEVEPNSKPEVESNSERKIESKNQKSTSIDRSSPLFSSTSATMSPILPFSLKYSDIRNTMLRNIDNVRHRQPY